MRKIKWHYIIISLIIPAIWLTLMGILYYRHSSRSILEMDPKISITDPSQVILREEWRGLYLNGEKIGYSRTVVKSGTNYVQTKYDITSEAFINLNMGGTIQRIFVNDQTILNKDLRVVLIRYKMDSNSGSVQLVGTYNRNLLRLTMSGALNNQNQAITLKEPPFSPNAVNLLLLQEKFPVKKIFRVPVFDPSTMSLSDLEIEIVGKESVAFGNRKEEAYKIEERFAGYTQLAWINDKGELLKESFNLAGLQLESMSESESEATAILKNEKSKKHTDIINQSKVSVTGTIPYPRNTRLLKLQLTGINPNIIQDSKPRQIVLSRNPNLLTTTLLIDSLNKPKESDSSGHLSIYTSGSILVQVDAKDIKNLARQITGNEKTPAKQADLLTDWLYKNIQKKYVVGMPTAIDVAKTRQGDCNEHAVLYAGLARALGIPTRIAIGVVYVNNGFYYHAWNEVWIGHWVAVDPTFGQKVADATHIKLYEGDLDQMNRLFEYLGKMQITILETKEDLPHGRN